MEMKAGMKYETEIIVNEGMLANHNDPQPVSYTHLNQH